ncbi:MAG: hypothetical protein KDC27_18330, partial [Acidobacteria bacterium]|nr:hypothetical protein [Acidobacteriota bacterium]
RGVRVDGVEQEEGFIINWRDGAVSDRPAGLAQYEVLFYVESKSEPKLAYRVLYEHDPATGAGYVYLPPVEVNQGAIYRGVEGNWFRSNGEWEEAIRDAFAKRGLG